MPRGNPKPIDWDVVIFYLEQGIPVREIKSILGYKSGYWSDRAKKELGPDRHATYKRLAWKNRYNNGEVQHGTVGGYDYHFRRGEEACPPCKEGKRKGAELNKWHKAMEDAVIEYKVDSRWSPKWKQQVYVVERHNTNARNPRLIAVYTERERAVAARDLLNQGIGDER